jgi:hypothetical protein
MFTSVKGGDKRKSPVLKSNIYRTGGLLKTQEKQSEVSQTLNQLKTFGGNNEKINRCFITAGPSDVSYGYGRCYQR